MSRCCGFTNSFLNYYSIFLIGTYNYMVMIQSSCKLSDCCCKLIWYSVFSFEVIFQLCIFILIVKFDPAIYLTHDGNRLNCHHKILKSCQNFNKSVLSYQFCWPAKNNLCRPSLICFVPTAISISYSSKIKRKVCVETTFCMNWAVYWYSEAAWWIYLGKQHCDCAYLLRNTGEFFWCIAALHKSI